MVNLLQFSDWRSILHAGLGGDEDFEKLMKAREVLHVSEIEWMCIELTSWKEVQRIIIARTARDPEDSAKWLRHFLEYPIYDVKRITGPFILGYILGVLNSVAWQTKYSPQYMNPVYNPVLDTSVDVLHFLIKENLDSKSIIVEKTNPLFPHEDSESEWKGELTNAFSAWYNSRDDQYNHLAGGIQSGSLMKIYDMLFFEDPHSSEPWITQQRYPQIQEKIKNGELKLGSLLLDRIGYLMSGRLPSITLARTLYDGLLNRHGPPKVRQLDEVMRIYKLLLDKGISKPEAQQLILTMIPTLIPYEFKEEIEQRLNK